MGTTLGLDIGALAIKAVFETNDGRRNAIYRLHKGNPEKITADILKDFGEGISMAAVTGTGGRRIAEVLGLTYIDPAVALIAATTEQSKIRHIIDIGGASLSIVDLDEEGRFAGFRTNSLCAAGTGSFLDEQARRMKLSTEEMSEERNIATPPRIAARCAVFAKSDLIHRQQEGFSVPEMWSGLCRGMVTTAIVTLFRGRKPKGPVLFVGGVAQNREVANWLKKGLDTEMFIPEGPATFSAAGAIRAAASIKDKIEWSRLLQDANGEEISRRPKLELTLSTYPSFECQKNYLDDGTEVRIHSNLSGSVVIGIDIGSTSTKAVITDLTGKVLADMYRRTSGDPIGATKHILAAITRAAHGGKLDVRGVGTTGSGRKMVGTIIGADAIVNEISAHARGAARADPDVETIFEIGGQDAKFISLKDGVPRDSNMNYVCAAGTGSFVEEQASKLGFKLTEIGDAVMGLAPPYSSDRCTVFMEQDVHSLIRAGFERNEVMGSVLYSVVQNYLNRVVGRRPYSRKKICFMGATARNRGLVAAFENLVGVPISVSPYCHVMGAFGVANIVISEIVAKGRATKFLGLHIANAEVVLKREVCELCANSCRITRALIGEDADEKSAPSWGYLCGRDPDELRVRTISQFDAFKKRNNLWKKHVKSVASRLSPVAGKLGLATSDQRPATVVGIPRALIAHSHFPFWAGFFGELGIGVQLSKPTDETTIAEATEWIGAEYCYPIKLAHGHVRELALDPKINFIFLPYIVQDKPHDDDFKRSVYCPYNIAFPSIIKSSDILESDIEEKPILSVVLNFQWRTELILKELAKGLAPVAQFGTGEIERAWLAAEKTQAEFENIVGMIGKDAIADLERTEKRGIVVLGRPYNVYDLGSNLNLPQKIADLGLTVLSVDMLPLRDVKIDPLYNNMYWRYGRKILQAATFISKHPRLHAVYLTNFGCGPDSFLQTFVEKIMHDKPMMLLEIDEHSADAGYVTRLEAFRDVIDGEFSRKESSARQIKKREENNYETLWIPPMHPYASPLLAAALRSIGKNAKPLPTETIETFEQAKRFCRGTECVPAPATIGTFLNMLSKSSSPEKECFFMPTAKGPCRFGQYSTLHRIILDDAGYKNTRIEAWDDGNSDFGLGLRTSRIMYDAIVAADLLYKARCRLRPYVLDRRQFDSIMGAEMDRMTRTVESGGNIQDALSKTAASLSAIKRANIKKPLVGIVGEIYVRLNTYTNGQLVETIEEAGGEAWVAPVTEWFKYLAFMDKYFTKLACKPFKERFRKTLKSVYMMHKERAFTSRLKSVIGDRLEPSIESTVKAGEKFFPRQFDGESILTVGRAIEFAENNADLIINCAPFGCMPGTLTAGIFQHLEGMLGIPIVSLFFDGESDMKHLVRTYVANIAR